MTSVSSGKTTIHDAFVGRLVMGAYGHRVPEVVVVKDGVEQGPLPFEGRHSPDGFAWGYEGSGPAELALAILTDVLGEEPEPYVYQAFKSSVIAGIPMDSAFMITRASVREWLEARK